MAFLPFSHSHQPLWALGITVLHPLSFRGSRGPLVSQRPVCRHMTQASTSGGAGEGGGGGGGVGEGGGGSGAGGEGGEGGGDGGWNCTTKDLVPLAPPSKEKLCPKPGAAH